MNVYIQDSSLIASVWANWSASLIQDRSDEFVPRNIGNQSRSFFQHVTSWVIMYMELNSFLFCKIIEYVNLYVRVDSCCWDWFFL